MNRNIRFLNVLLVFALSILYGCSGCSKSGVERRAEKRLNQIENDSYSNKAPEKKQPVQVPSQSAISLNELFKKYQSSVFMVLTSDGDNDYQGTGFFISGEGIAISNYHVFKGTWRGLEIIKTIDGDELKIESILDYNDDNDYIIFKVASRRNIKFNYLPIAKKIPEIGEDVFSIGNPRGLEHTLSKGIVSGYRFNETLIQTTAEITHGSSGGPLINMKGEVVGITTSGLGEANLNFAINIKALDISRFLKQELTDYHPNGIYDQLVSRVIDGDTFVLENGTKVRIIGVDTPELKHPRKGKEAYSEEAFIFTKNLIEHKVVTLELDTQLFDRYKRLLAYVFVDDVFLNEVLLLEGMAVVSTYPPNVKYVELFTKSQEIAKANNIGMWSK